MTPARYRAWRFDIPGLDAPESEAGLQINPSGGIEMVEDEASVQQSIFLLLMTRPGERVMRPNYGCDLGRLQFSPNDATTAGFAIHYVRKSLLRWEPRIEILFLDAAPNVSDPGRLDISLEYRVRSTRRTSRIEFPFNLTGEVA